VWPVSSKVAKAELYGWLKLQPPTDESRAAGETFPPGFCHHPEYGEDYFKQLTAEQLVPHRKRNGFTAYEWEQIPGRENHYLDTRVYARSAAAVVGLDRFSEADWCELERDAGQEQLALPLADGAASAETTATSSSASPGDTPPAAAASAWLRRRRRWLR
jgi:phage terminase large subunit GpA-like protein